MSVYKITFSPTGGTQKVADLFAGAFCRESVPVDLTDCALQLGDFRITAGDVCIVAIPSYGGRLPAVAVSRLKQMAGGGAKAVLIAVFGNRAYEDTLLELRDVLTEAGFCCVAAVAAVAEHSILRQFAAGRPDEEDAGELAAFAAEIRQKLETGDPPDQLVLPGNSPYRAYGGGSIKPRAGKACTKCGRCAVRCPVGAIPKDDPSKTDDETCITCMRCVATCPNGARSVRKTLLAVAARKMKRACGSRKKNELFL